MTSLRDKTRRLLERCLVLSAAVRDPRTPWYAKAIGALTLLYAVSPIDLIPDFIPVVGLLDDLVLVPLGVWATMRLIPRGVWAECEARVAREKWTLKADWRGALIVVFLWFVLLIIGIWALRPLL